MSNRSDDRLAKVVAWVFLFALLWVARGGDTVCRYETRSRNILCGAALDGQLTISKPHQEVLFDRVSLSVIEEGVGFTNRRDGRIEVEQVGLLSSNRTYKLKAKSGMLPGATWICSGNNGHEAVTEFIFRTSGVYRVWFSIEFYTSNVTRVYVDAPTGRMAQAWQSLPKETYLAVMSGGATSPPADVAEVPQFLQKYSDSEYASNLVVCLVGLRDGYWRRSIQVPQWITSACEVGGKPEPFVPKDIRAHRIPRED